MKFQIAIVQPATANESAKILHLASKTIDSADFDLESLKQQIEFLPAAIVNAPMPAPSG